LLKFESLHERANPNILVAVGELKSPAASSLQALFPTPIVELALSAVMLSKGVGVELIDTSLTDVVDANNGQ
jgi:hypothetical protein